MLKAFATSLQLLRSSRVRRTLSELLERLSSASLIGAVWLFYAGSPHARVAIPALLILSPIFFFAAVLAMRED